MATESANDFVQEQLTDNDITANYMYNLFQTTGLMHDLFAFLNNAGNGNDRAMMDTNPFWYTKIRLPSLLVPFAILQNSLT